jgi:hypothetical protein
MSVSADVRHLIGVGSLAFLAACAPSPSGGVNTSDVRPLEEILVEAPRIEAGATRATVYVTTEFPVACSVVYGPTLDYGSIATDSDMAGGAHADHHPVLGGLQADTTYYFRLQGTGPDGTLYRSEEYTLLTLPGDSSGHVNLASAAAGATVLGASSEFGGSGSAFAAENAIDGDASTQWSSEGDGDDAWFEIALAGPAHISRVGFWTRTMGSSAQILSFHIVTDQGEVIGPFDLADAGEVYTFDTDFTAQRLRFEAVETSGGNTGAVEIEVYGTAE